MFDFFDQLDDLELAWGQTLSNVRKIYLDTNFWIYLRDAARGQPRKPEHSILLSELRSAVAAGRILCPGGDCLFSELMKQEDPGSRLATADLMDELGRGCTLRSEEERVKLEAQVWLKNLWVLDPSADANLFVWTRPAFILGRINPMADFPIRLPDSIHRLALEELWSLSMRDMAETGQHDALDHFVALADRLNEKTSKRPPKPTRFQTIVESEFASALRVVAPWIAGFLLAMNPEKTRGFDYNGEEAKQFVEGLRRLVANAFVGKPQVVGRALRTIYINAKCHAAFHWDRGTGYKPNNFPDYHHAAAAVGYCDAFFTEGNLAHTLNSRHVNLSAEFECFITADCQAAIAHTRRI